MVQQETDAVHRAGLENARSELDAAQQWFEWVTDPRLVDEAVFRLRAAEMRLARAMAPWRTPRRS